MDRVPVYTRTLHIVMQSPSLVVNRVSFSMLDSNRNIIIINNYDHISSSSRTLVLRFCYSYVSSSLPEPKKYSYNVSRTFYMEICKLFVMYSNEIEETIKNNLHKISHTE